MPSPYPKPEPRKRRPRGHNSTLQRPSRPMAPMSAKRRKVYDTEYLPKRKAYLEANPWCRMNIPGVCPKGRHEATEIQHMIQRSLDPSEENLLDERYWLPSCHDANTWAGIHPAEARLAGVEIDPRERAEKEGLRNDD